VDLFFQFISIDTIFRVFGRTVVIFVFAFMVLRLLGKRHLAHLTYLDLLLIMALGSAIGDVMIYEETTAQLLGSMIAIAVVGLLVKLFNELSTHSQRASSLIEGTARLIIKNGQVLPGALEHEDLSHDDLLSILRERGVGHISKIKKAFIEPDGEVSVVVKHPKNKRL